MMRLLSTTCMQLYLYKTFDGSSITVLRQLYCLQIFYFLLISITWDF